eukprot:g17694.t1
MVLEEQFIQKCREAFNTFDQDGSGTIDTQDSAGCKAMKLLLEAIGEAPSEEELFRFMADVDEDGTGEIEFAEFLRAFEKQRGGAQDGRWFRGGSDADPLPPSQQVRKETVVM